MALRNIKPTTLALLLAALVMLAVGTYTDNGGFQLAGVILLVVVLITAFNQARDRGSR
jgi:ABC-type transport system involved in cytochrome bd biosynthesis fused ATPase/permease subunit